jgi:hypothetical protein
MAIEVDTFTSSERPAAFSLITFERVMFTALMTKSRVLPAHCLLYCCLLYWLDCIRTGSLWFVPVVRVVSVRGSAFRWYVLANLFDRRPGLATALCVVLQHASPAGRTRWLFAPERSEPTAQQKRNSITLGMTGGIPARRRTG